MAQRDKLISPHKAIIKLKTYQNVLTISAMRENPNKANTFQYLKNWKELYKIQDKTKKSI